MCREIGSYLVWFLSSIVVVGFRNLDNSQYSVRKGIDWIGCLISWTAKGYE